jgi:hypothetical protein
MSGYTQGERIAMAQSAKDSIEDGSMMVDSCAKDRAQAIKVCDDLLKR